MMSFLSSYKKTQIPHPRQQKFICLNIGKANKMSPNPIQVSYNSLVFLVYHKIGSSVANETTIVSFLWEISFLLTVSVPEKKLGEKEHMMFALKQKRSQSVAQLCQHNCAEKLVLQGNRNGTKWPTANTLWIMKNFGEKYLFQHSGWWLGWK